VKDVFDKCLHNANHYLINENGNLFISIFDKLDKDFKKDVVIVEALVRNIIKSGNISVTELKVVKEEILKST
jgi:3-methyladenine DNA glycosylase AlkC